MQTDCTITAFAWKSTIVLAIALMLLYVAPSCFVRAEITSTLSRPEHGQFVFERSDEEVTSTLWRLEFHTPSDLGLDIVFVPEDYGADEMDRYRETVEKFYRALLCIQPFSRYRNVINVWRIDTTVDFEAERPNPNMPRLLTVNCTKVCAFVKSMINIDLDFKLPDDQIIVLVNTPEYGGSSVNQISVAYAGGDMIWSLHVMVHEFGHSFGNLGDEYVVYDEDYPAGREIPYPNIDWDGSKWKGIPGTGAYLGAWYRNLVRPTERSCIMRTVAYLGFCPVCERALAALLEHYSPPIGLTLRVSPNIAGIKVKINASSYTTDSRGEVSVILGRRCYIIALDNVCQISEFVRCFFKRWEDGSTSPNRTLYLASNTTITAFYQLQYLLQLRNLYDVPTSLSGAGWYDAGSIATISIENTTITKNGARHIFTGWSGGYGTDKEISIHVDAPKTVTALWKIEYYLEVITEYGEVTGAGWYDAGSTATFSVKTGSLPVEGLQGILGAKYVFEGWTGDYTGESLSGFLVMDRPHRVVAVWKRDYMLLYLNVGIIISVIAVISILAYTLHKRRGRQHTYYSRQPACLKDLKAAIFPLDFSKSFYKTADAC